jgi:hypothetical protein
MDVGIGRFQLVDIESESDLRPVTFIDKATYKDVLCTFVIFLIFESVYVYTALRASSFSNTITQHYPLTQSYSNRMADIKIRIAPLEPLHRFIHGHIALARHGTARSLGASVIVNTSIDFFKGDLNISRYIGPRVTFSYSFG